MSMFTDAFTPWQVVIPRPERAGIKCPSDRVFCCDRRGFSGGRTPANVELNAENIRKEVPKQRVCEYRPR